MPKSRSEPRIHSSIRSSMADRFAITKEYLTNVDDYSEPQKKVAIE